MREKVISYVATCQLMLELTDDIKNTQLYYQSNKNLVNRLQKNLESYMKGDINEGFVGDGEDFNLLMKGMEDIINWIANVKDFNDILDLAKKLNNEKT